MSLVTSISLLIPSRFASVCFWSWITFHISVTAAPNTIETKSSLQAASYSGCDEAGRQARVVRPFTCLSFHLFLVLSMGKQPSNRIFDPPSSQEKSPFCVFFSSLNCVGKWPARRACDTTDDFPRKRTCWFLTGSPQKRVGRWQRYPCKCVETWRFAHQAPLRVPKALILFDF